MPVYILYVYYIRAVSSCMFIIWLGFFLTFDTVGAKLLELIKLYDTNLFPTDFLLSHPTRFEFYKRYSNLKN